MFYPELRESPRTTERERWVRAGEARFDTIEAVGLQLAEFQGSPSGRNRKRIHRLKEMSPRSVLAGTPGSSSRPHMIKSVTQQACRYNYERERRQ